MVAARLVSPPALTAVAPTETERDLDRLEGELKKLEAEYNMFFAGRLPRPPWETRTRVEALVKQYDRAHIQNYAERFRFWTLQARYAAFVDLWDALRNYTSGNAHASSKRVLLAATIIDHVGPA